jgi:hypothetical protein
MPDPTPLIAPELANAYAALAPAAEALLRVIVGFALVPHGSPAPASRSIA